MDKLAELERLMKEATEGPWSKRGVDSVQVEGPLGLRGIICFMAHDHDHDPTYDHANAALIVAAHNALPELIEVANAVAEEYPSYMTTDEKNAARIAKARDVLSRLKEGNRG